MWTTLLAVAVVGLGEPEGAPVAPAATPGMPAPVQPAPEPAAFFQQLSDHYRTLTAYEDRTDVVEVVTRPGEPAQRVQTRIACRLEGDTLSVESPGDQVRQELAASAPSIMSPALESLVRRYNLWLAPHMTLHFSAEPLKELRLGVPQGFVASASALAPASGDGKPAVRVELRSAEAPSPGGPEPAAAFSLWVDPETMLVRRIAGHQKLPDGAEYEVTLEIAPRVAP